LSEQEEAEESSRTSTSSSAAAALVLAALAALVLAHAAPLMVAERVQATAVQFDVLRPRQREEEQPPSSSSSRLHIITDILLIVQFAYSDTNTGMAYASGICFMLSLLIQCLFSFQSGQPAYIGLAGLIGMKPMIEAYRSATDAEQYPTQNLDNDGVLQATYMIEVV
jgi:hypothetical protein